MPNTTLFSVAVLSGGSFNGSGGGAGNLGSQDKLGGLYPAPASFSSFSHKATKLEVGYHECRVLLGVSCC